MFDNFSIIEFSQNHWPFLVVALALGTVGEILKRIITPNGNKGLTGWRWWWFMTLPLHPAAAGFTLGLFAVMPCPEAVCPSTFARGLYYAGAGMLSSYVYAGVKHVARERLGADAPQPHA